MGLPESSVRGFWIAWAGFAVEASDDVARARRGTCCDCENARLCTGICLEALRRDEGARKSRYSDCEVARGAALLYVRMN
jgi:hypothetical protein